MSKISSNGGFTPSMNIPTQNQNVQRNEPFSKVGESYEGYRALAPDDPRLKYTICPFMSSALKEGLIKVDENGNADVKQLKEVLGPFGGVPAFFAKQNHAVDKEGKLKDSSQDDSLLDFANIHPFAKKFNPWQLAGSKGDHIGDSKILSVEKGFDAQRFEEFVSHSQDGKTMTMEDFGRAVGATIPRDSEVDGLYDKELNASKSAGEWALMVELLGKTGEDGVKRVDIQEMRNLFENNQFPEGWTEHVRDNASRTGWVKDTAKILHHSQKTLHEPPKLESTEQFASETFRHSGVSGASLEGIGLALGASDSSSSMVDSLQGIQKGVCPVGGNDMSVTNMSDVQAAHSK